MEAPFHYRAFVATLQQMGLKVQRSGRGVLAQCPAHPDRTPSMKVDWSDNAPDFPVLVSCKAGCETLAVCKSMGDPTGASLYPARVEAKLGTPPPPPEPEESYEPTDTYVYTDEQGVPLSHVIRLVSPSGKKKFRQCRADGVPSLEGVRRVLYRLHEWQGRKVLVFAEGEKDVETLRKWGIVATTNIGGASSWRPEYMEQVKAAGVERLVILVDNDTAGKKHGHVIAAEANAVGIPSRIIVPPGVPEKGDITDWVNAGGTKDALAEIVKTTPFWKPGDDAGIEPPKKKVFGVRRMSDLNKKRPSYLIESVVPDGMFGEIAGRDGRGKSLLGMEIARAILRQQPLFGEFEVKKKGPVLLVMLDDPEWLVNARLEDMGMDPNDPNLYVATRSDVDMSDCIEVLRQMAAWAAEIKPVFILIDALYIFVPASKGSSDPTNNQGTMMPIMEAFDGIANASEATVGLVAHENKAGTDVQGSQSIRNMAKWILRLTLPPKFEKDINGGKVTPQRVLQLEKDKTGGAQEWGLRLSGPGKWERCEIEVTESKAEKKAKLKAQIVVWLRSFLEDGAKTTRQVQEASWEDGFKFPWHIVNHPTTADEAGVEKTHSNPEAPWMWSLRTEHGSDQVPAVQPEQEGEGTQQEIPGIGESDLAEPSA